MASNLEIDYRHSVGNLHIQPKGEFDGVGAWALIKTIRRRYNGIGRVFVNTAALEPIHTSGVALFRAHMTPRIMPLEKLYFKGKKGFDIGPDGSRVIISKKGARDSKKGPHRFRPRLIR